MIVKTFELQKLNKTGEKCILLYGENEGFKNQVFNEKFLSNFENKVERYDENEVLNNLDNFISSLINKSFFDNSKLVLISRVSDKIIKLIDIYIDKNISDVTIVLNAGILEKKSKLRSKFEKDKNYVCMPFYPDTDQVLIKLAYNFFRDKKMATEFLDKPSVALQAIKQVLRSSWGKTTADGVDEEGDLFANLLACDDRVLEMMKEYVANDHKLKKF